MCGGESRRMGKDKGLLEVHNIPWARIISDIFETLEIPYLVSINASQVESYSKIFDKQALIEDGEISVKGPLKGLLTIYKTQPTQDLLLIACDMKDMDAGTVKNLIDIYASNKAYDFFAYQLQDSLEPFCAIYTSNGLNGIYREAIGGTLRSFSLKKILENGNIKIIPVSKESSFNNYNTPG